MKEFYCRAEIKTEYMWSDGFIHISKDGVIEGLFALDYVRIELDGKVMSLLLTERYIDNSNDDSTLVYKMSEGLTMYTAKNSNTSLESPYSYALLDGSGSMLFLKLKKPIKDPLTISALIQDMETYKCC